MEDKKLKNIEQIEKEEKQKNDEKLPYCTTAPSAEHHRASDDDEPCDDSRAGDQ